MQNAPRFSTVFHGMKNIHLIKDPGMIPHTMKNCYGYQCIVPLSRDVEYSYKSDVLRDVDTPVIDAKVGFGEDLWWIATNARKIDILNVFFFDRYTWLSIWIYRLINHKGLIYVHCDTDGGYLISFQYPRNVLKNFLIKKVLLTPSNLENTLWGVQNKEAADRLKGVWPFINIAYVPDGVFLFSKTAGIRKENQILTVSRNGTKPKRTDILLEGFARVAQEFPTWKLILVGTVEDSFQEYIKSYFIKYPELKQRVSFTGPVYDRDQLMKFYAGSKVFCLTSAWESFGIVTAEAISNGCYVVASDIPANRETTDNGKYGTLFESGNVDDFAEKLRETLSDEARIRENIDLAICYAREKFSWENSLRPVNDWILKKIEEQG